MRAWEFVILLLIHKVGDLVKEIRFENPAFCEVKFEVKNFSVGPIYGDLFVKTNVYMFYGELKF